MKSSIQLISNIQILEENKMPLQDNNFLSKIVEVEAVKELKKSIDLHKTFNYELTKVQTIIFRKVSRCDFAIAGDYPWGVDKQTLEAKCYCLKTNCELFNDCHPEITQEMITDYNERKRK